VSDVDLRPTTEDAARATPAPRSELQARLRQARRSLGLVLRNRPAMAGIALLATFVVMALIHPVLMDTIWRTDHAIYRPETGYDAAVAVHPSGPSSTHWLGTDPLGRDVFSLLLYSTRPSLTVALIAAGVIGVVSVLFAVLGAYLRGRVDTALGVVSDALLLLPAPIALIVISLARPDLFDPVWLGLIYGVLVGASGAAIVLRSQARQVMTKPFIEAARAAGGGGFHLVRVHLLPHVMPLATVQMMGGVAGAVIAVGFVEYLSAAQLQFGYGSMIYQGLTYQGVFTTGTAWNVLLAGGLAITFLAASFHLISVGLRQVLDPTLQRARLAAHE
jgi:peptide/nickel transport system permease protein